MKKLLAVLVVLAVFFGSCDTGINGSDVGTAMLATRNVSDSAEVVGSNGSLFVSGMSGNNLTVSYEAGSRKSFCRLFVSEGNGSGLILAMKDMNYSNGVYSYTVNHPTFTAGASVYVCVLVNDNGVETCVPKGTLAATSSWGTFTYGETNGSTTEPESPSVDTTVVGTNGSLVFSGMTGSSVTVSYNAGSKKTFCRLFLSEGNGNGLVLAMKDMTYADGVYSYTFSHPTFSEGAVIKTCVLVSDKGVETCIPKGTLADTASWGEFSWSTSSSSSGSSSSGGSSESGSGASGSGESSGTGSSGTTTETTGATGLYRDSTLTYATWTELESGTVADFAIGEWEGVNFSIEDSVATISVGDGYWHGATLAQLPAQVSSVSYYDFSNVAYIKFYIKSSNITASTLQFIMQNTDSANIINAVALSNYGVSDIKNWTEVSIPVSAFRTQKIKTAFALSVGNVAGSSVQVKQIGFVDASGNNVDVTGSVVWPKTNAASIKESLSLAWSDEFNGSSTTPDTSVWTYDTVDTVGGGWGNNELQTYTTSRKNSYVSNGTLKIAAVKDGSGNWTSGRVKSKGLKDFTYGYVEFRAKVADGAGMWPALWMLPTDNQYGVWPASGEIDVMEYSKNIWNNTVYGTVHCNAGYGASPIHSAGKVVETAGTEWHTYAVYWTGKDITWYFDDALMTSYSNPGSGSAAWPFDKDFHIIMNVAVGGNLGGIVDSSLSTDAMEVDYVRVYK